ncbi:MAG: Na(+)/H(+) antiporter subunit B [Pseudomonadota bacterium]
MKLIGWIIVTVFGGLLIYGTMEFPDFADPQSPAALHVSPYYIEHSMEDAHVVNVVTTVLADYRGYDTMFETAVIFSAGIACILLLRVPRRTGPDSRLYRHIPTGITIRIEKGGKLPTGSKEFERIDSQWVPYDVIIKTACRLVIPFIQLFALYVIAHGHYSPGGGFQGGVIYGAAIILFALSTDLRSTLEVIGEKMTAIFASTGVLIYAGTGLLCALLGGPFLNYGNLAGVLGVDPVMARSHGILIVETGVGLAVMAVMVSLYYTLSSVGRMDEGL